MRKEYEALSDLRRQFEVVRRRIDGTVMRLSEAKTDITADGLDGAGPAAWAEGRGDLFQLCVRLEVALAESNETADTLARRLREMAGNGENVTRPTHGRPNHSRKRSGLQN